MLDIHSSLRQKRNLLLKILPKVLPHGIIENSIIENLPRCRRQAPTIGTSVVRQLLTSTTLERLLLQNVPHPDSFFTSLLESNPLLNLVNIVIDQCDQVTAAILWRLLEIPNQLRILRCWNCREVNDEDGRQIKRSVRENNLTLYFEYYPFCEANIVHDNEEYDFVA